MTVFADGVNITQLKDAEIKTIQTKLLEDPKVLAQYNFLQQHLPSQLTARKAVKDFRQAIAAWESTNTKTTHTPPSPESLAWSNLEGGHSHHETPSFSKWIENVRNNPA